MMRLGQRASLRAFQAVFTERNGIGGDVVLVSFDVLHV